MKHEEMNINYQIENFKTLTTSAAPGLSDPYAPIAPLPDLLKACTGSTIPFENNL